MNNEIVESFAQIARDKSIDKDLLASIIEEIFMNMIRKKYFTDENFSVIVNMEKGDIEILQEVLVSDDVFSDVDEISLEDAKKIDPGLEVGDECVKILPLASFGRRLIMQAKQTLNQKIRELEKENTIKEYNNYIGDILVGDVYQINRDSVLINHNKVELIMPKSEQIYKDRYKKGETIRAVLKNVERGKSNAPRLIVSRTDNKFLERLFENEVPEIYDGLVIIKSIAREPGDRAKIAVESTDDRIDPIGACVGMKGVRIHSIVKELNNENIDVVLYSNDIKTYVARALAPAKILKVEVDEINKKVIASVHADQVALAVGRVGQNIRLASKLTGYEIEIYRVFIPVGDEDIDIIEFEDEFSKDLLEGLINSGYDSANKVLNAGAEKLASITGFNQADIEELVKAIEAEYDDENSEDDEEETEQN